MATTALVVVVALSCALVTALVWGFSRHRDESDYAEAPSSPERDRDQG